MSAAKELRSNHNIIIPTLKSCFSLLETKNSCFPLLTMFVHLVMRWISSRLVIVPRRICHSMANHLGMATIFDFFHGRVASTLRAVLFLEALFCSLIVPVGSCWPTNPSSLFWLEHSSFCLCLSVCLSDDYGHTDSPIVTKSVYPFIFSESYECRPRFLVSITIV